VAPAVDERDARMLSSRSGRPPSARALAALVAAVLGACAPALTPAPGPAPAPTSAPAAPPVAPAPTPAASVPTPSAAPATASGEPPLATDAAAESLLVDVRRVDSTVAVELRYATRFNFTGAVLPGYEAPHALLRREAVLALARVQEHLRAEGLGLKIFDAYRPVRATEAMVEWTRRVRREDLLRDGYIAEKSRHNLGLAVDLTLVELASGKELRMGTAFDTFAASAHTANATGVAAENRQRLKRAMEAEGFTNLPEEWWHFSYAVPDPLRFDLVIR
jgi:D-alanyl-D-alanine dipeptidase